LQRIDLDRYHNLKEVIEKQDQYEKEQEDLANVEILKKKWKCKKCHSGHLEIMKFNKLEETWYYRQCINCDNRTMAKRFTDKVLGIFHFAEDNKK
jgi:ssDNA-binding Zn-finger/Zn-ribbon topoisomerase 1